MRSPPRLALLLMAVAACHDIVTPPSEPTFKPEVRRWWSTDGMTPVLAGDSIRIVVLYPVCAEYIDWLDGPLPPQISIDLSGPASGSFNPCNWPYGQPAPELRVVVPADGILTMTMTDSRFGTGPLCKNESAQADAVCRSGNYPGGRYDEIELAVQIKRPDPPVDPTINIVCAPNPVTRGINVTCSANDGNGQPVQASNWTFTSTDSTVSYSYTRSGVTSASWPGGEAAISGRVSATASGISASTTLTVNPRVWPDSMVNFTVINKGNNPYGKFNNFQLFDPPADQSELGDSPSWTAVPSNLGPYWVKITSGPNTGLYYAIDNPIGVIFHIAINQAAMTAGSTFYDAQGLVRMFAGVPPNAEYRCNQADVLASLSMVQQHEGAVQHQYSHVSTSKAPYASYILTGVEKLVKASVPTPLDVVPIMLEAEYKAPIVSMIATHDPRYNPYVLPCVFKY